MNKKPLVSIIVLNYNGVSFLRACIPTITSQSYSNIEIIVTDNHSSDDSLSYLKNFPNIKVLHHPENYGYAKANNIAATYAKGEILLFLNNDTELEYNSIEELVRSYKKKCLISLMQIPTWDKNAGGFSKWGMDIFGYPYTLDNVSTSYFYIDGAAFCVGKSDFFDIGCFDEELFIFQEDIDFCWRAQMYGYTLLQCDTAIVYHYGGGTVTGGSTGEKKHKKYTTSYFRRYLNEKNIIRNLLKNYSLPILSIILPFLLTLHVAEISILLILGKFKVVQCYLQAYYWNIKHIKDTLTLRSTIQQKRTVSDTTLMKKMYWNYQKITAFRTIGMPNFT